MRWPAVAAMPPVMGRGAAPRNVVCPFCSLLCDDLELSREEHGGFRLQGPACPKAAVGFGRVPGAAQPRIGLREVEQGEAVAVAGRLLRGAQQVLLGGLGLDVDGMRAAVYLAERHGAVLDHAAGAAINAQMQVLQRSGWFNTTLAEVKNRADLLLLAGTDGARNFPRFLDRIGWLGEAPRQAPEMAPLRRRLCFLGTLPGRGAPRAGDLPALRLPCTNERLAATVDALTLGLRGRLPPLPAAARPGRAGLERLLDLLRGARYCVVAWEPGVLPERHASSIITALCDLVRELNLHGRSAGMPLAGSDGAATAMQVCCWQSGYPLRVSYQRGFPEYDPQRHSAQRLLSSDQTDAVLWVDAFKPCEPPRPRRAPVILLCPPPAPRNPGAGDIYLPIGVPGLDHAGTLFRCDSVVSMPLAKLRDTALPRAAALLEAIARVGAARPS